MRSRSRLFAAVLVAILVLCVAAKSFAAEAYGLTAPVVHENMSVYLVRGSGSGGAAPLTLDQGLANGSVKIYETERHPLMIENVSNQSVFVQLGDLIRGGMQDQVVGTSMLLPPHSGQIPLVTFCVDPFRSAARDGEDAKLFSTTNALFASQLAKLSILTASDAGAAGQLREAAVWWSIDALRAQLTQKLGVAVEPVKPYSWSNGANASNRSYVWLASRSSAWTSSLPLSLENPELVQAQVTFADAFKDIGTQDSDIVGAVFVINGKIAGADIYQSSALFRQAWLKLLGAYSIEALATIGSISTAPSQADISAFLAAAQAGQPRDQLVAKQTVVRDSESAIFTETAAADGQWTYRSFVPKLDPTSVPTTPAAMLVQMLETGKVDGRSLASLSDLETVIIKRDDAGQSWVTTIHNTPLFNYAGGTTTAPIFNLPGWLTLGFLMFLWFRIVTKVVRSLRNGAEVVVRSVRAVARGTGHVIARTVAIVSALVTLGLLYARRGGILVAGNGRQLAARAALRTRRAASSLDPARIELRPSRVRARPS